MGYVYKGLRTVLVLPLLFVVILASIVVVPCVSIVFIINEPNWGDFKDSIVGLVAEFIYILKQLVGWG